MYTQYVCSTDLTPAQLQAVLDIRESDTQFSMNRIMDYLNAVNAGDRKAYITTFINPIRAIMNINVIGSPLNGQTFTINQTTYTAVTSGAGARQFNIGSSSQTATNILTMLNADPAFSAVLTARSTSSPPAVIQCQAKSAGKIGNGMYYTASIDNVLASGFSGGSDGTTSYIAKGLSAQQPFGANFTGVIVSNDSLINMTQTLDIEPSSPTASLTRLINLHSSLGYSRRALFISRSGGLFGPASVTFTGLPDQFTGITINQSHYYNVNSNPTWPQFQRGSTVAEMATNLAAAINHPGYSIVTDAVVATAVGPTCIITPNNSGIVSSVFQISIDFNNATLLPFYGSNGNQDNLLFGSNDSQSFGD